MPAHPIVLPPIPPVPSLPIYLPPVIAGGPGWLPPMAVQPLPPEQPVTPPEGGPPPTIWPKPPVMVMPPIANVDWVVVFVPGVGWACRPVGGGGGAQPPAEGGGDQPVVTPHRR